MFDDYPSISHVEHREDLKNFQMNLLENELIFFLPDRLESIGGEV